MNSCLWVNLDCGSEIYVFVLEGAALVNHRIMKSLRKELAQNLGPRHEIGI